MSMSNNKEMKKSALCSYISNIIENLVYDCRKLVIVLEETIRDKNIKIKKLDKRIEKLEDGNKEDAGIVKQVSDQVNGCDLGDGYIDVNDASWLLKHAGEEFTIKEWVKMAGDYDSLEYMPKDTKIRIPNYWTDKYG